MRRILCLIFLLVPFHPVFGNTVEDEIELLISEVGKDGCRFVRNDRRYSTRSARAHLRSKWELNEHLIASTEDFINKIASQSVTTGEPYIVRCRSGEETIAKEWFFQRLFSYRSQSS